MTRTLLDKELQELNAQVLHLSSLVADALGGALAALETGDQDKAGAIVAADTLIDDLHLAIEKHTFRILTMQQPLAGHDLRYLTSLVPVVIDLERIGDEAEAIAQNVLRMMPFRSTGLPRIETLVQQSQDRSSLSSSGILDGQFTETSIIRSILALGQQVRFQLEETMKAFAARDVDAAHRLWEVNRPVDKSAFKVRRDLMTMLDATQAIPNLQHDPHMVQRVTCLLWIVYQLERVAAHCSNICERIVFIAQGDTSMQPC